MSGEEDPSAGTPESKKELSAPTAEPIPMSPPSVADQQLEITIEKLWVEYEMIQRKLDVYTDYPFKIKAASVTLTAAFWAGGKLADFPWYFFLVALLIPPVFRLLEVHHDRVKRVLGGRAIAIEEAFHEILPFRQITSLSEAKRRTLRRELRGVPFLGLAVKREDDALDRKRYSWKRPKGLEITLPQVWKHNWTVFVERLSKNADNWFVIVLFMVICAAILGTALSRSAKSPSPTPITVQLTIPDSLQQAISTALSAPAPTPTPAPEIKPAPIPILVDRPTSVFDSAVPFTLDMGSRTKSLPTLSLPHSNVKANEAQKSTLNPTP